MDKNGTCVDHDKNSTPVQSVSNTGVLGLFTQVYDGAMELVASLPSVSKAVKEVKEAEIRVRSILEGITASSDPEVRDKLATLRKDFCDFIQEGKECLEDCISMAKYATNEQHITEIKQRLERKILDELKKYTVSLSDYLKDCDESFQKFLTTHKEMCDQVSCAKGHFSDQHKKVKEEASDAVTKFETAVFEREDRKGLTTFCSMVGSASAKAGALAIISPNAAFSTSMFSYALSYLARTNEGKAARNVMEQERAREEMAKKEKILQDAIKCVVDLRESVLNAALFVKKIKSDSNRASKVIEKKRGLNDLADSNKEDIDFHDLANKLDTLQRAAGEILKNIGEDGITPISSNLDELVSNTQPHQTTDQNQATMQDWMRTLNISSQPNGNFSNHSQGGETAAPLEQAEQELVDREQAEEGYLGPEQAEEGCLGPEQAEEGYLGPEQAEEGYLGPEQTELVVKQ